MAGELQVPLSMLARAGQYGHGGLYGGVHVAFHQHNHLFAGALTAVLGRRGTQVPISTLAQ